MDDGADWLRKRVQERLDAVGKGPIEVTNGSSLKRDYISNLLKGDKRSFNSEKLPEVARVLDCDPDYLTDPTVTAPRRAVESAEDAEWNAMAVTDKAFILSLWRQVRERTGR